MTARDCSDARGSRLCAAAASVRALYSMNDAKRIPTERARARDLTRPAGAGRRAGPGQQIPHYFPLLSDRGDLG